MHEAELLRRPTAMHIDAARAAAAGDQTEECGERPKDCAAARGWAWPPTPLMRLANKTFSGLAGT